MQRLSQLQLQGAFIAGATSTDRTTFKAGAEREQEMFHSFSDLTARPQLSTLAMLKEKKEKKKLGSLSKLVGCSSAKWRNPLWATRRESGGCRNKTKNNLVKLRIR